MEYADEIIQMKRIEQCFPNALLAFWHFTKLNFVILSQSLTLPTIYSETVSFCAKNENYEKKNNNNNWNA